MIERSPNVLPQRSVCAGVVRRKQQREHVDQPETACRPNKKAENERQTDCKFTVCHEKRNRNGMR